MKPLLCYLCLESFLEASRGKSNLLTLAVNLTIFKHMWAISRRSLSPVCRHVSNKPNCGQKTRWFQSKQANTLPARLHSCCHLSRSRQVCFRERHASVKGPLKDRVMWLFEILWFSFHACETTGARFSQSEAEERQVLPKLLTLHTLVILKALKQPHTPLFHHICMRNCPFSCLNQKAARVLTRIMGWPVRAGCLLATELI